MIYRAVFPCLALALLTIPAMGQGPKVGDVLPDGSIVTDVQTYTYSTPQKYRSGSGSYGSSGYLLPRREFRMSRRAMRRSARAANRQQYGSYGSTPYQTPATPAPPMSDYCPECRGWKPVEAAEPQLTSSWNPPEWLNL